MCHEIPYAFVPQRDCDVETFISDPPMACAVKVAVIGLGYVGLPVAATLAHNGVRVVGIDIDPARVEAVSAGQSPLSGDEPGLGELLAAAVKSRRLKATSDYGEIDKADAVIISVETPIDSVTKDPQYRALKTALRRLAPHLQRGALVSIESTITPGTMASVVKPILERGSGLKVGKGLSLTHCPERVTTGKLLHNLVKLDRVVGAEDPTSLRKALTLYRKFVEGELHAADWISAEITKTAENAYRDVQLAFANELALICEELGANAYRVRELVNSCPGRDVLLPGAGVGGHCIPKDPWLLVAPVIHQKPTLIPAAREVNDYMPIRMAQLVEEAMREAGRRIRGAKVAVLGFAYRENTDDARNSPAILLVRELRRRGADIAIHDPYAKSMRGFTVTRDLRAALKGADCLALVTAHDAYRTLDLQKVRRWMRHRAIVDGRNAFDGSIVRRGFAYRAIGKGEF